MSVKDYRIVYNKALNETLVTGITKKFNARLNGDAGNLLCLIENEKLDTIILRERYPDFYAQCEKYGWIKNNEANYNISIINSEYHLKRIQIELTLLCNLNCSYCYSNSGPTQKSRLTVPKVKEFIDDAYRLGCLWIDFTGGEPLAYKGWEEVIGYAIEKGLSCSLHTNGTLLDEDNVLKLKRLGVKHVQISLDSHIAEVHDTAREKKGAFNKTINGIKLCQANKIPVTVSIVAHQKNRDHYVESVNYLTKTLRVKVLLDRVIRAGREMTTSMGISTKEYYEMISPLLKGGSVESRVCDNYSDSLRVEPHCGVAHSFVYITAEGEFSLCPTMTSRDDPILFNSPRMDNFTLETAWTSSPYILKYRGLNCRNVSKCPTGKSCGGGCRSNAYIETGELSSPDFLSCNVFKNSTKQFIDFKTVYN